jgi:hypothetical protein
MVQSLTERPSEAPPQAAASAEHRERNRKAWNLPRAVTTVTYGTQRDGLDWDDFRDLNYPNSHRHDFEAIVAYGVYKRSPRAGTQSLDEATDLKGDPVSTEVLSLDEWEDEGGASH